MSEHTDKIPLLQAQLTEDKNCQSAESAPHPIGRGAVPTVGGSEPPFTNRGVVNTNDSIRISIHWLEITFFCSPKTPVTEFMGVYFPWYEDENYRWEDDFTLRGTTGRHYNAIYDGPDGVVLYAYPKTGNHCSLQISGSAIEKLGQDSLFRLLEAYQSYYSEERDCEDSKFHWQCTRIDIAFDNVPFTPAMCRDSWLAGNVRTRSHPDSYDWRSNAEGDTFYMGKRISGRLIRVYNRRGPVRLELELKKKFSVPFVRNLAENGFMVLRETAVGTVRDMVDFIDVGSDSNKSRAALLDWWSLFVGDVERIRFSRLSREDSASAEEIRLRLFYNRMKPSLYMFAKVLGHDLNEVANSVEIDLKPHHFAKIRRIRPQLLRLFDR